MVTVTARDEHHRQQVLRQVKRNIKKGNLPVKATCWLSALQRSNKNYAYASVAATAGKLQCIDWGDRVLILNPATTTPQGRPQRCILDTALSEFAFRELMTKEWAKWGIPAPADARPVRPARPQGAAQHPPPAPQRGQKRSRNAPAAPSRTPPGHTEVLPPPPPPSLQPTSIAQLAVAAARRAATPSPAPAIPPTTGQPASAAAAAAAAEAAC